VELKTLLADIAGTVSVIDRRIAEDLGGDAQDTVVQQDFPEAWVGQ